MFVASHCVYKFKKHHYSRYIKFKFQKYIYFCYGIASLFQEQASRLVCFRQHPSVDHRPQTWKIGISDSFWAQILPKILPVMHIFSFKIMTCLKKLTGIKFLNTKQCPAGFLLTISHINN